ncbi:MAG: 3'-5' exonuclease [Nitrospiraceae bacterium]|nr:3'-5' exonuclease [Nitrospiraceae bacterium]
MRAVGKKIIMFRKKKAADANAPAIHGLSVTEARYTVFDTELTGLDEKKDGIISMGAVKMTGGRIELGETFNMLANPGTNHMKPGSVIVHGITPSELAEKPPIGQVLSGFLDFCGGDIVVGHMVSIDLAFIGKEMKRLPGREFRNRAVDTFSLVEWLRKRGCRTGFPVSGKLHELARCLGIAVRQAHDALMDAFITAQLFQRLIPLLAEEGVGDIEGLLRIGDPDKGGERHRFFSGEIGNF